MKNKYLFLLVFAISHFSYALKAKTNQSEALVYVRYQKGRLLHQYWIQGKSGEKASLLFKENEKPIHKKGLPAYEAKHLTETFTRLYWETRFKKSAASKNCTEYAKLKIIDSVGTQICHENPRATGNMYGLLVQLEKLSK